MNTDEEPRLNNKETLPDVCVCCGAVVPEGAMVCWGCQHGYDSRIKYENPADEETKNGK